MPRIGGRADDELRTISVTYERLDRVDGSARFGFGELSGCARVVPLLLSANNIAKSSVRI